MKKIMINKVVNFLTLMVFVFTPFTGFAADMWAETPDLNNDSELPSAVTGPAKLTYKRPAVDLWAETPDMNSGNEARNVVINGKVRVVNNIVPEMYNETPDLNVADAERQDKVEKDFLIGQR